MDEETLPGWKPGPRELRLPAGEVHVWGVDISVLPATTSELEARLVGEERERARAFKVAGARRRFVVGRVVLRNLLGGYLGVPADHVAFRFGAHGKPALEHRDDRELTFNLTHSHELVLVALTRSDRIGVDVERIVEDRKVERTARRFFSSAEVEELTALSASARERAFFRCWTLKEAFLKADGAGLSRPLGSFDVSVRPDTPAELRRVESDSSAPERWHMEVLPVGPGYAGALAVEAISPRTRLWRWLGEPGGRP